MADTRSRKWQLTINNPEEKDLTHDKIKDKLSTLKSLSYYCMCDETGLECETYHTHIFLYANNAVRFSTIKNLFPSAHIECCNGTSQQNRDYIRKEGKYASSSKKEGNIIDTFEEFGTLPIEQQGKRNDLDTLYDMIKSGMSDAEIIATDTSYMLQLDKIQRVRNIINQDRMKNTFRQLDVSYIWGVSGTGKTRYVMEKYGYDNVYKITNYDKHPFDSYEGQDVILFDEFRSQLRIGDMLQYLDGYPINLPARYGDRTALFTKVYLVSNINLSNQYTNVQTYEPRTWQAFLRRIQHMSYYSRDGVYDYELNPSYLLSDSEIERKMLKLYDFDSYVTLPC